jgi:Na+:H+ antiporter
MHDPSTQIAFSMLVIFVAAKLLSELFERLRLPGIVGEILAGVLVGPHVLGWIAPNQVTELLAQLGVMFLLFRVGLEVKSSELMAVGGRAAWVAVLGVILPFLAGWGIAVAWGLPTVESVFIGAALVATSVGITAQVLTAGGWLDARASRIILAAAVIDDVLGLLVLAAVSGMAKGNVSFLDLAITASLAVAFVVVVALFGTRAMRRVMPRLHSRMRLAESEFALALSLLFALSLLAAYAGVAAIVGAFLAGMALSETVERRVHALTEGVTSLLVPFFLAGIGLHFDPTPFRDASNLWLAVVLTLAAVLSKFVGCGLASLKLGRVDAIRVGVGMIPRGEVGMVVAQIGLGMGVLAQNVYGTIVFVSVITTIVAPPLLRLAFRPAHAASQA